MMRAVGQSVRQIAGALGVGSSTVLRDISDSKSVAGVTFGTPENNNGSITSDIQLGSGHTVTGRDGKTYAAKVSQAANEEPCIPERLKSYFNDVPLFQKAAQCAEQAANAFQEIEQTPAFQKANEGKKPRLYSTTIRAARRAINAITPRRPCPRCGGEFEPSLDNDPCKTCGGRGYQTDEEVAAEEDGK
jgi:hypothetical protein